MGRGMLVVAGLACALLTGCGASVAPQAAPSERVACTRMGGENGVRLDFSGRPSEQTKYQVCIGGDCRTGRVTLGQAQSISAFVPHPKVMSTEAVKIVVYAGPTAGKPVAQATAPPEKVTPNGPRCDPTVYHASVKVPA